MARAWADEFRSLNRAPFAVGLIALVAAILGLIALGFGGWSWWFAILTVLALALGVGLIAVYYQVREGS
jgi:fatty acid desaturase